MARKRNEEKGTKRVAAGDFAEEDLVWGDWNENPGVSHMAGLVMDMLAAAFREHPDLLFTDYPEADYLKHIASVVQESGRTVWNGT